MRILSPLVKKDKKGVSNIIGYVMLIAITISLSVMVYAWLRWVVPSDEGDTCPEGVSVIIQNYECTNGFNGGLNLTLKNKGRFSVDGFILRVHDRADAKFGYYMLNRTGGPILPGEEYNQYYYFNDTYDFSSEHDLTNLSIIEVQPYRMDDNDEIICKALSFQKTVCS